MNKAFETAFSHVSESCFCRISSSSTLSLGCSSFFCSVSQKKVELSTTENVQVFEATNIADVPSVLPSFAGKCYHSIFMLISGYSILNNFISRLPLHRSINDSTFFSFLRNSLLIPANINHLYRFATSFRQGCCLLPEL